MATQWHLAQLNVGRTVAPLDDPRLAGFMNRLDEINAIAEGSPGYVWRLQSDSGNATDIQVTDDPLFIINLTVWLSIEALFDFAYRSEHKTVVKQRSDYFERWPGPNVVLWWQPAGIVPDVQDALRRLRRLEEHGPTPEAFSFKVRFPPPEPGEQPAAEPSFAPG